MTTLDGRDLVREATKLVAAAEIAAGPLADGCELVVKSAPASDGRLLQIVITWKGGK